MTAVSVECVCRLLLNKFSVSMLEGLFYVYIFMQGSWKEQLRQKFRNMRRPSKTEKRHREEDAAEEEEDSAPKRSRSVHVPMTPEDKEVYEGHIQELHDELANEKPSKSE